MVKKLGILGFILIAMSAATMVWAGTFTGAIPAPEPQMMPAAAPPACIGGSCAPPPVMKPAPMRPKKLTTTIDVKMQYPQAPMPVCGPMIGCAPGGPPPIPVAVPMWKFIVPWPPFVYYLPVE